MLSAVGLLAISAVVGVRVTAVGDVPEGQAALVLVELDRALKPLDLVVVGAEAAPCAGPATCIAELRRQHRAEEVLLIELLGGPLGVRCLVSWAGRTDLQPTKSFEHDLPRDLASVRGLAELIRSNLYPQAQAQPARPLPTPTLETPGPNLPLWIALGVSVAAVGGGVGLGLSSQALVDRQQNEVLSSDDHQRLYDRSRTEATLGNVLLAVGISGLLGCGIAWLVAD